MFKEPDRRRIYLLRHAEAAYLQEDGTPVADTRIVDLTANGAAQARRQSEVLADVERAARAATLITRRGRLSSRTFNYRDAT